MKQILGKLNKPNVILLVVGMLTLCAFAVEQENEAQIDTVDISGMLAVSEPFTLHLEVRQIREEEIRSRLKQLPLYGANPIGTNPKQRVMQALRLTVRGKVLSVPQSVLRDLFDPGLVYTLHVTSNRNQ